MNILLTNDDGYLSDGFRALYNSLTKKYNVFVCAPMSEKSSVGHSISLYKRMQYIKVNGGFAVDGTPADCVKVALHKLHRDKGIDIVISGINKGINMGHDIFYSGTVAGAREGLINGIPAIAFSKYIDQSPTDYTICEPFVFKVVDKLISIKNFKFLFNVNFPRGNSFKGIKMAKLGNRLYTDTVVEEVCNGENFVSLVGDKPKFNNSPGSDLDLVSQGFVSVTPLRNTEKSCDFDMLEKYSKLF